MASPPSRKRFKVEEVLRRLDLSDEEGFEEYDSDRLSENELDDVEPEADMDSDATEDYRFRMMLMQMLGLRLQILAAVTQILLVIGMLNEIIQAPSQPLPRLFGRVPPVTTPQMWNLTIVTPLD